MSPLNLNIYLPKLAKEVINLLEQNSYQAWIVGGFVRDAIIGNQTNVRKYKDIDIATNAKPNQIEQMFSNTNWTIYSLGKKFGTIAITTDDKTQTYEITTYRTEQNYTDGRHPDSVVFSDTIKKDLSRRDFTCNAIAYNPNKDVFDPYNGVDDIKNKIIKCVGDPNIRFQEDYLRIIRALRFASELNFSIDNKTQSAITKYKSKLNLVSFERIRDEFSKLLCGKNAKEILTIYKEVIFEIIPELKVLDGFDQKTKYHSYDVYTHTIVTLDKTPPTEIGRWAALLHDIGKPECFTIDKNNQGHFYGHPKYSEAIAKKILKRLKFSKKISDSILLLVRWHDQPMANTKKSIKKILVKFSNVKTQFDTNTMFKIYCDLRRADSYAHATKFQENLSLTNDIEKTFEEIILEQEAFSLKDLKIKGNDIIDLGVEPGPNISKILNACLDAVINEQVTNNKEELIKFAKNL